METDVRVLRDIVIGSEGEAGSGGEAGGGGEAVGQLQGL